MIVRLAKAHFPVTALGYGTRIGIWFQGCSLACRGCLSVDTWASTPAHEIDADDLLDWCSEAMKEPVDGVTFSGGEPFEQPDALAYLAGVFNTWRDGLRSPFDLLCYSGLSEKRLRQLHPDLVSEFDALIPGAYVASRPDGAIWRGSDNQVLLPLTALGAERYGPFIDHRPLKPPMQVAVSDREIWYIGVPRRGDLQRLDAVARNAGIQQRGTSWTA